VERHSRGVFRLAFRMTGNEHDAEDVVQETFLKAYRKLDAFEDGSGRLRAGAKVCTENCCACHRCPGGRR